MTKQKVQHGGLHTISQKIGDCSSHADSRCIYRIFKYLQKNHNIFKIASTNSPFKGFNIIHNEEHAKKYYKGFINLHNRFDPINTNITLLKILKGSETFTFTSKYIQDFLDATSFDNNQVLLDTIVNLFTLKKYYSDEINKEKKLTKTDHGKAYLNINIDNIPKNNIHEAITVKLKDLINFFGFDPIIIDAWNNLDTLKQKGLLIDTDIQIIDIMYELDKSLDANAKDAYKEMLKVQNYQKDIYFTIFPILVYNEYILNNIKTINRTDGVIAGVHDIRNINIDYGIDTIIKNETYFPSLNKLYFGKKFSFERDKLHLRKQIERFNNLIKLIPENLTIGNYYYKNIDDYLTIKKEKGDQLYGNFNLSIDLANQIDITTTGDILYGHTVAIDNLEKKEKENEYELTYKNSWGVKFGDEGREKLTLTKSDLENDYYDYNGKNVKPIYVWVLELITENKNKLEPITENERTTATANATMIETVSRDYIKEQQQPTQQQQSQQQQQTQQNQQQNQQQQSQQQTQELQKQIKDIPFNYKYSDFIDLLKRDKYTNINDIEGSGRITENKTFLVIDRYNNHTINSIHNRLNKSLKFYTCYFFRGGDYFSYKKIFQLEQDSIYGSNVELNKDMRELENNRKIHDTLILLFDIKNQPIMKEKTDEMSNEMPDEMSDKNALYANKTTNNFKEINDANDKLLYLNTGWLDTKNKFPILRQSFIKYIMGYDKLIKKYNEIALAILNKEEKSSYENKDEVFYETKKEQYKIKDIYDEAVKSVKEYSTKQSTDGGKRKSKKAKKSKKSQKTKKAKKSRKKNTKKKK